MSASRRLAACGAALTLGLVSCGGMPTGVSSQISPEYRETVRAYYRGLASLEVGLLDDAQAAFERAAALAPDEPAIRANLAVVHVGFGNETEAAGHIEAARGLAPDSAEIRFLEAQLAGFQGRFEEAVAGYRQVVELDQTVVAVLPGGEDVPMVFAANGREARRLGDPDGGAGFPFPTGTGPAGPVPPSADGVLALDWNGDYRMDLVLAGQGGVRLWQRDEEGDGFAEVAVAGEDPAVRGAYGVWAADTEMDGEVSVREWVQRASCRPLIPFWRL